MGSSASWLLLLAAAMDPAVDDPVRREFQAICRELRASDDRFFGQRAWLDLERQLASGELDQEQTMVAQALSGRKLVEQGEPGRAIPRLEAALATARRLEVPGTFRQEVLASLAMAHLQAGEDANCLARHTAASCIVPLSPEGVHQEPGPARRARDLYLEFLRETPNSLPAAWLANLAAMISGDAASVPPPYRLPPDALLRGAPFPRWRDRAPELGVNAVDLAGGAIMDDFDGDGWLDLVSSTADPCDSLKAFRNDGRGGFEDVSRRWGLDAQLGGLNLVHGDADGDGRLDLLVLRGAWMFEHGRVRSSLLRNELHAGGGGFRDVTLSAGLGLALPTQTAAFADYDGDGDLDLYVGYEALPGQDMPSRLYRNRGDGSFEDVTLAAGVANQRYAKAVAWGDADDDGDPDLYVSNIGPNRLYRNRGDGTFVDVAPELGLTEPSRKSFATWFFDFDNDGDLDLFVTNYDGPLDRVLAPFFGRRSDGGQPLLYRNDGGRFTEISSSAGLDRAQLPMGANYGDLDNDGWLDVYLGTGDPEFESLLPNVMLRNAGGVRFEDVSAAGGFGHLQKGHGVAFGDLDGDGDQDLFHQLGGFFPGDAFGNALFENPGTPGHWLTLRLVGRQANRFGVGARIAVRVATAAGPRTVHLLAGSGGSFGGSSMQQEVGLGADATAVLELLVRWPGSGTVQRFEHVAMDRVYEIVEGDERLVVVAVPHIELGGLLGGQLGDARATH